MKTIIGIRHGEAYKNLKDIYGGNGSELTEKGQVQVEGAITKLKGFLSRVSERTIKIYISCPRVQIVETAEFIKSALNVSEIMQDDRFAPIRLGVLDGMSRERQRELYPEAVRALELWDKGEGDINDFRVDGAQTAIEHVDQLKQFINGLEDNSVNILVGTRSDMCALKNIVLGNDPSIPMQYKYLSTDYANGFVIDMDEMGNFVENKYKIKTNLSKEKRTDEDFCEK